MRISDWSSDVCSSDLRCCGERNPPCPQNTCRNPFIGFQSPDGGGGAGRWLRWCPGCSPWLPRDGEAAPAELRKQPVVAGEVGRADRHEAVRLAQQAPPHRPPPPLPPPVQRTPATSP